SCCEAGRAGRAQKGAGRKVAEAALGDPSAVFPPADRVNESEREIEILQYGLQKAEADERKDGTKRSANSAASSDSLRRSRGSPMAATKRKKHKSFVFKARASYAQVYGALSQWRRNALLLGHRQHTRRYTDGTGAGGH